MLVTMKYERAPFIKASRLLLIIILFQFSLVTSAQTPQPQVTPPSPNAASLGKFADIPVGYYTGTPQINVPLYEMKEGDLTLPIRLDYHAGGIKVEENASWVGLGFGLQAGGSITHINFN